MSRKGICWGRIPKNPEYDLCGTTTEGLWDIVNNGVEGWIIYTPTHERFIHNGREWVSAKNNRGVKGAVTRDQAKAEAERMFKC